MNYKIKTIAAFMLSMMASAYGNFSEDAYCQAPNPCSGALAIEVDFLMLRPYEKISDPCAFDQVTNTVGSTGEVLTTINNTHKSIDYTWQPAFRISAGYQQDACQWKSALSWTHLHCKSHNGHENSRKWHLDFDTLDAFVAYTFYGNENFSLTSMGGLRGAKIDQNICFSSILDTPIHNRHEQKFWGVGPSLGFEAMYNMGCNFSLYANFAVSWLYGKYHIKQNDLSTWDIGTTSFQIRKHVVTNQFVSDAGLGAQWSAILCNCKTFLRLGLEHHHYFDYNYLENSSLSLSGGSLSAGFEF